MSDRLKKEAANRFHPFQGRPLFGHVATDPFENTVEKSFPSLSGKTSIRTTGKTLVYEFRNDTVSIPFREDLYSDERLPSGLIMTAVKVSIPFREDLYSDNLLGGGCKNLASVGFHPFQGRPLFGPSKSRPKGQKKRSVVSIPFREDLYSDTENW